jgi:hypothetical protein
MRQAVRRKSQKQVTVMGSRVLSAEEATQIRVELSNRFRLRQAQRLERRVSRLSGCPERMSVAKAMFAVEQRIVEALWTLARLPNDRGIGFAQRNGIGYMDERSDLYANAVANGGWLTTAPRPAPPSAKAIDAMHEPLDWLRFVDREAARILTISAQYKRGDMARNIGWTRLRERHKELHDYTARYLARRYQDALRTIVTELTIARVGQMP